jgi:hypothetical protein
MHVRFLRSVHAKFWRAIQNCRRVCECLATYGAREVTPARPEATARVFWSVAGWEIGNALYVRSQYTERRLSNPEATPVPQTPR